MVLHFRSYSLVVRRALIVLVGVLALVPGAHGADPQLVQAIGGSCGSGPSDINVPAPASRLLVRVSSPASSALWLSFFPGDYWWIAPGDTRWFSNFGFEQGGCDSGAWTGGVFTIPDAPTSFDGVSTFNNGDFDFSRMLFRAPAGANYVASVSLRQGAVSLFLRDGNPVATFASSGTYRLGFTPANEDVLVGILPRDGPPAIWNVSITPAPIALGGSSVDRRYARPGQLVTLKYSVSGDAKLDAAVRGKARVVRQLATGTNVAAGPHSVVWDGLDGNGKPVADGVYSIDLTVGDIFGSTAKTAASVTIDTHPPEVTFQTPKVISPRRGVVFKIVDRLSGYRNGFVKVDGRSSGFQITRAGVNRFVVTSPSGWTPGSHSVTVTAFDRIGNRGKTSKTFRVR